MKTRHLGGWDIAYLLILIVSIPVLIDYFARGLYGQILLTILFLAVGLVGIIYSWRRGETLGPDTTVARPARRTTPAEARPRIEAARTENGRLVDWLPASVISGFAATGVLSAGLMVAYGAADLLGSNSPGATLLERWMWSLTHNPVTEAAQVNLPAALVLNFVAGIIWAVIYAGLVECKLSGPGWRRGVLFSLIPWVLSIVVFLPIVGGGFLGMALDAGPLPVIGNLILHLAYGLTLGEVYASERVQTESGVAENAREAAALRRSERTIALAFIPGLVIGGLIALVGSGLFAPAYDPWLVAAFGAIAGSVVAVILGSFAGLPSEPAERKDPAV